MPPTRALPLLALVVLAACSTGRSIRSQSGTRGDNRTVTAAELAGATQTNLYAYLVAHHPRWFESQRPTNFAGRSTSLTVFLDNQRFGDVNQLKSLSLNGIKEVRFYSVTEAPQKFNVKDFEAVIHVVTR